MGFIIAFIQSMQSDGKVSFLETYSWVLDQNFDGIQFWKQNFIDSLK